MAGKSGETGFLSPRLGLTTVISCMTSRGSRRLATTCRRYAAEEKAQGRDL
jgi:hypothetical protein